MAIPSSSALIPLVVNRRAGRGFRPPGREPLWVTESHDPHGIRFRVLETEPAELPRRIQEALEDGASAVAVAGGDGTHRTAAEILAGTGTTLIPVPTGTFNHFARRCGIGDPSQLERVARSGRTEIDAVAVADDRVFVNTLITGSYPDVVMRRDRYERMLPRWLAAPLAFLATALRSRPVRLTLETEQGRRERCTRMVWIGLGRGSFPSSHRSEPVGKRAALEVAVLRETGALGQAAFMLRLLAYALGRGDPPADPRLEIEWVRSLVIRSHGPVRATLDGEPMRFRSPLFVGRVPGALRVRVAPPADSLQEP